MRLMFLLSVWAYMYTFSCFYALPFILTKGNVFIDLIINFYCVSDTWPSPTFRGLSQLYSDYFCSCEPIFAYLNRHQLQNSD